MKIIKITSLPSSLILLAVLVCTWQCNSPAGEHTGPSFNHSAADKLVVDTIIYPVTLINPDSTDTWTDSRLKHVNQSKLTSPLFEALYSGIVSAYDYYTHEPIPVSRVKEMEASGELDREQIAQLQFEESWYFNNERGSLNKKVHGILLATPVFNDQQELRGYKAAFVVKLNP